MGMAGSDIYGPLLQPLPPLGLDHPGRTQPIQAAGKELVNDSGMCCTMRNRRAICRDPHKEVLDCLGPTCRSPDKDNFCDMPSERRTEVDLLITGLVTFPSTDCDCRNLAELAASIFSTNSSV